MSTLPLDDHTFNILVVGIGGQGVMTASEILAETALALGHDAKKTEMAGMAQRGGVVTSHVRIGRRVLGPAIPEGEADLLLGFEPAEALRWRGQLRATGLAVVNSHRLIPPVVTLGLFAYPEDPLAALRISGVTVLSLDASGVATELGDRRLVNSVMLGAVADHLPLPVEAVREAIRRRFRQRRPENEALNAQAFDRGREAIRAASESQAA